MWAGEVEDLFWAPLQNKKELDQQRFMEFFFSVFYFGNIPQHKGEGGYGVFLDSGHRLYLPEGGSQISPAHLGLG